MIKKNIFSLPRVQNYWNRQNVIKYFFILIFILFAYRIITISRPVIEATSVKEIASKQAEKFSFNSAHRGDILDTNRDILASSLILKKINLDPTLVQIEFIEKLANVLNMPKNKLSNILAKKRKIGSKYLIVKKNIPLTSHIIANIKELKQEKIRVCSDKKIENKISWQDTILNELNIKNIKTTYKTIRVCKKQKIAGVAIQEDSQRYYPKSASLAPLLGRINKDKEGVSGIEGEFDNVLAGSDGKKLFSYKEDSRGLYFNPKILQKLKHGDDIELTIDANIQFHAYEAIKNSVKKHNADSGSAIILSADGEILALVNYPADDPNDKTVYNAEHYRNRVLSDKVEPGSTMKPFTMLLALDKNKITATEEEFIDVTKRIAHIKPDRKYKKMTVKKILQKSHNLGTVNISQKLDKEDMYATWHKLGFGQYLGLIPSIENQGSLRHFDSWSEVDKYTLSFGHGPMETNLAQLARAYLVFANDGYIKPLKLIKNANISENKLKVFRKESVDKIAKLLDAVVSNKGSGYRAQIKGYNVAGKTGTAEMIIDGSYNKKGAKRTFFVGFTPVENPKYIMAIRLDYPKKCFTSWNPKLQDRCEGSNSASMVFKEAMSNILSNDQSIKFTMKN